MRRKLIWQVAMLIAAAQLAHASALLTLSPASGVISGYPGTTIGWGYTITNTDTNDWLELDDFSISPAIPSYLGTFTDFTAFNFIVVGPSSAVSQNFDPVLLTGVGSFAIAPNAPTGPQFFGIVMEYDLFSVDPTSDDFDPVLDTISTGNQLDAPAGIDVVPEPATWLSMVAAFGLLGGLARTRLRMRHGE
jgi:hypothetical protein